MAKKTAAKYTLSRKEMQKRLDAIVEKLEDFEFYDSTINDIENLLGEVAAEAADLSWELTQTQ